MNTIYGTPVVIDDSLGVEHHRKQTRFPRSKKMRIRNKWAKQSKNWKSFTTQKPVSYIMQTGFRQVAVMNSKALEEIKAKAI